MVSPTVTLMVPLGPSKTALPSNASRTVQFAIPLTSIPGFISVEVCLGATFAFASGAGGVAGFAMGCATGFAGGAVVGCTTRGVTPPAADGADPRGRRCGSGLTLDALHPLCELHEFGDELSVVLIR